MKAITIELRFDDANKQHPRIMREAAQEAARILVTQAALIAGKRQPQIKITMSDAVSGHEDVPLFDEGQS